VTDIDKRAFGLTRKQFASVCFDYAEKNGVKHRFNVEKKSAGEGFIREFMRESGLTMRKPESTSVARLMAFNRVNVGNFFELLRDIRLKYSFMAELIYNVDETGFSTVATKTPKVISSVGTRRVIKISSAERGVTVTCVCAMRATGKLHPSVLYLSKSKDESEIFRGYSTRFSSSSAYIRMDDIFQLCQLFEAFCLAHSPKYSTTHSSSHG